jgi:excisionase family DNA binding protein
MTSRFHIRYLPINVASVEWSIGGTTLRKMIADGRLRAVRVGTKKLLIEVESWHEYLAKHNADGVPEYTGPTRGREVRMANAAAKRKGKPAKGEVNLEELGLL